MDKWDERAVELLPCHRLCQDVSGKRFHAELCPYGLRPAVAAELRRMATEHCKDCCCAQSWAALGITQNTGGSIPEHITELRAQIERLSAELYSSEWSAYHGPKR